MGREEFELLKGGVLKRRVKRRLGLFIDGSGLDRATRRLERKVDLSHLVAGLSSGLTPEVARYYTLIPNEDDARQFSFLDAVERAGLEVVLKRLPPKGVKRQVSMDVHLASDLVSFGYGHFEHAEQESKQVHTANGHASTIAMASGNTVTETLPSSPRSANKASDPNIKRIAVIVCPSREISYAIYMSHLMGVETSLADFGLYGNSSGWKGVERWIDLSTSETIWRD